MLARPRLHDYPDWLRRERKLTLDLVCASYPEGHPPPPEIVGLRAALGQAVLQELAAYAPFSKAERTVSSALASLEKRLVDLPSAPANFADVTNAAEIRSHMKRLKQDGPGTGALSLAYQNLGNPRIVAAWLYAEPFQSGLTDKEHNTLREQVKHAVNPVSSDMQQQLTKALDELRTGMRVMRLMIMQRCGLEQHSDGAVRMIGEPQPEVSLVS